MNVYYTADVPSVLHRSPAVPDGVTIRSLTPADIPALAEVYLRAYDPPLVATLDAAVAEMISALDGTWGPPWLEASPAAWIDGDLAAAVLSVRRPSMTDAPACPWLIEVFTAPRHRRSGLARALITTACRAMNAAGEPRVGLTVDDGNVAAVALYRSLGFTEPI